jgi:hypothetical protein
MPTDTYINPGTPPGDLEIYVRIDSDSGSVTQLFTVENNAGGGANRKLMVNESGWVRVYGPVQRQGAIRLNNTNGAGTPVNFYSATVEVASVDNNGRGDFSAGGVNLLVVTSAPNGVRSGSQGDLVMWYDGAASKWRIMVCAGGTSWSIG